LWLTTTLLLLLLLMQQQFARNSATSAACHAPRFHTAPEAFPRNRKEQKLPATANHSADLDFGELCSAD